MKRTELRKFIDCFRIIIESEISKVVKLNVHFVPIGSLPRNSSGNTYIESQQRNKQFNLEPPKLRLYQPTKILAVKIFPRISSALRDLDVIFDKYFYLEFPYGRVKTVQVLHTSVMVHKTNSTIHRIM